MPFFAVFVGAKSYCYLVPAQSARKAEKAVQQYLAAVGQNDACVVSAIPARRLPSAKAKNAPQKKRGVVIAWPTARRVYRQERKTTK